VVFADLAAKPGMGVRAMQRLPLLIFINQIGCYRFISLR
jgi:hypothetical protein